MLFAAAAEGDAGGVVVAAAAAVAVAEAEAGTDTGDSFVVGEFDVGVVVSGPRPKQSH